MFLQFFRVRCWDAFMHSVCVHTHGALWVDPMCSTGSQPYEMCPAFWPCHALWTHATWNILHVENRTLRCGITGSHSSNASNGDLQIPRQTFIVKPHNPCIISALPLLDNIPFYFFYTFQANKVLNIFYMSILPANFTLAALPSLITFPCYWLYFLLLMFQSGFQSWSSLSPSDTTLFMWSQITDTCTRHCTNPERHTGWKEPLFL